ncbi:MAG: dTDP-4-dehydrorhamnose 3,5-epimerase [Verrucomicrobiota bacterium]|nr:dTDP-4-dehydrorhamnose 3,5-epimerase [Verrucomicrobiota bacterium]
MKIIKTKLPGVLIIEPTVLEDSRGFFMESYNKNKFSANAINVDFVQDNHSRSTAGTLRGLHWQAAPQGQDKLVRVVRGEIYDVAVDVRRDSSTFGQWVGVTLSETNKRQLFIPKGFAHGFCVLSKIADFLYKCTAFYSPEHEKGILWNDSKLNIDWPIKNPLLSEKDKKLPHLSEIDGYCEETSKD